MTPTQQAEFRKLVDAAVDEALRPTPGETAAAEAFLVEWRKLQKTVDAAKWQRVEFVVQTHIVKLSPSRGSR